MSDTDLSFSKDDELSFEKKPSRFTIGLEWEPNNKAASGSSSDDFDGDLVAVVLGAGGKMESNKDFIYFKQRTHNSGAISLSVDNTNGADVIVDGVDTYDEEMAIDLDKLPSWAVQVDLFSVIFDAASRRQDWSQLRAVATVIDTVTRKKYGTFDLGHDHVGLSSVQIGSLYKKKGEWNLKLMGIGHDLDHARIHGHYKP